MLISRTYLVARELAGECIMALEEIESNFARKIQGLVPGKNGITVQNFMQRQANLIKEYNEKQDELFTGFVRKHHIAEALNSNQTDEITFDNFFGWDISFFVHSSLLFMEVKAANEGQFPVPHPAPPFLRELDGESLNFANKCRDESCVC